MERCNDEGVRIYASTENIIIMNTRVFIYICIYIYIVLLITEKRWMNNKNQQNTITSQPHYIIKSNKIHEELATPSRQGGETKTTRPLRTMSRRRTTIIQFIHNIYVYIQYIKPTRWRLHRADRPEDMCIMYIQDSRRCTSASSEFSLQRKFRWLSTQHASPYTAPSPLWLRTKFMYNTHIMDVLIQNQSVFVCILTIV